MPSSTTPSSKELLQIRGGALGQGRLYALPDFSPIWPTGHSTGTEWPLCPHCGCPGDKSALHSPGYSAGGGATELAHRKRRSPPHANNNLVLRRPGPGRGTSSGGRSSLARWAGSQGCPGGDERGPARHPGTATSVHMTTATRTACANSWGNVYSRGPGERGERKHESGFP